MSASTIARDAWGGNGLRSDEREFLPAALEIMETPASPLGRAIAATIGASLLIAIAWASFGHIDIVATAQGKVVPTDRVKSIQPLDSGVIASINVRDGDRVKQGDVLIAMDQTASMADRDRIRPELQRVRLDVARLSALIAGLDGDLHPVNFAPPPEARAREVARARAVMTAQAEQQIAKIEALEQQIAQKRAEADSVKAAIDKVEAELPLVTEAAEVREKAMNIQYGNRIAYLDAKVRLTELQRELVVQRWRLAEVEAAQRSAVGQRDQARAEYVRGLTTDLVEAEQKAAQLTEDLVKAERRMQDQILRAPIDGTVQQLAVHTVGGVVTPAQPLLVVVPAEATIEIEAMLANRDVGFVRDGDEAEIKVDTFNFTKYGVLRGRVTSLSRDAITRDKATAHGGSSQRSGDAAASAPAGEDLLYAARIALGRTSMLVDGRMTDLEPGMAVTAEIKTGKRRIIEYLLSPLLRYEQESLRER
ncbi:HlyD family type I secretion periplasmic adaptor subunit [Bradyrhizobium sp. CCBAU 11434]|uniref:HlyD family type I secretion periplasmic adaptor subunit n=1 Tax=Bradyrhizobium sp. CCBAU 11434 TaxID=1630885 RepID=UPI00230555D9|nr:HlyD family type I secretion periplasmic adaptor subunit [Bradyrhizobium sp. CCBAU 11434]